MRERERESLDPHRALVISLRSFSESSKKRETTSTTKSGLLSSWSCWSCKNWASRIPFSHQQNKAPQNQNQHIENKNNPTDQKHQTNKTNPYETCSYILHFLWLTSINKDFVYSANRLCIWPTSMLCLAPLNTDTPLCDPIKTGGLNLADLEELLRNKKTINALVTLKGIWWFNVHRAESKGLLLLDTCLLSSTSKV